MQLNIQNTYNSLSSLYPKPVPASYAPSLKTIIILLAIGLFVLWVVLTASQLQNKKITDIKDRGPEEAKTEGLFLDTIAKKTSTKSERIVAAPPPSPAARALPSSPIEKAPLPPGKKKISKPVKSPEVFAEVFTPPPPPKKESTEVKEIVIPKAKTKKTEPLAESSAGCDIAKVNQVKSKHKETLGFFESSALKNNWGAIRSAHYDWWMFPLNQNSSGHGTRYNVAEPEIKALLADPAFMLDYKKGVVLVVLGWGWDLRQGVATKRISPKDLTKVEYLMKAQYWNGYGVRLAKMSDSLQLFAKMSDSEEQAKELIDLHEKLRVFFVEYCLAQKTRISDFKWLKTSFSI